jgi:hypothetical protein
MTRKNFLINLFLISALVFLNVVLSQGSTLFKTENRGFRLVTNQDPNLVFELSYDTSSAYLTFGYKSLTSAPINSSKFSIRPSVRNMGSILYSEAPNEYGGRTFIAMQMDPNASSVIFRWKDEAREGLQRFPKIYGNIKDLIAIYNCTDGNWLDWQSGSNPGTCLGKYGWYSATPPGGTYLFNDGSSKVYLNPQTCFGDNSGIVLQEICTGDCGDRARFDDAALTICIRTKY